MEETKTPDISNDFKKELEAFLRSGQADQDEDKSDSQEQSQAFWTQLFNEMNFPGMDLMAVSYFNLSLDDLLEQRNYLRKVSKDFLKLLGYNYANDLRSAGVSEEGIFYIKKGLLPENFCIHLKYPTEYGGRIDFNNMVFIQCHPFHDLIHAYIDQQLVGPSGSLRPKQLYVPVPVGKIYIPSSNFTGSGGKNKQDRSAMSGFTQSAIKDIMMKSMPGR